jgi:exopolysaccharide production protein ExoQ
MAKMIRELIFGNPLLLFLVVVLGVVLLLLLFQFASNKKNSALLQKGFAIFFIIICPELTKPPYNYLHPVNIAAENPSNVQMLPYLFYPFVLFVLFSPTRLLIFNFANKLPVLLYKNPGFWMYIFMPFISVFWAVTPVEAFKKSIVFLILTFFGVYISLQYSWDELSGILRWSNLLLGLMSYVMARPGAGDWVGLTKSKNKLGAVLALSTAFWYLHYSQGNQGRNQRNLSLIITIVSFYLMRVNKSGGALVICILLISLVSLLSFVKRLSFQWAFTVLTLFLIVGIILTLYITENIEAIVVEGLGKDLTLTGRTIIWPMVLREVAKRPILGYGYHSFWNYSKLKENSPAAPVLFADIGFRPPHSHNGYIEILVYFGAVGFFFFFISLLSNLSQGVRYLISESLNKSALPLMIMTFLIINNILESSITDLGNVWVYYVIVTVRLSLDTAESRSSRNRPLQGSP